MSLEIVPKDKILIDGARCESRTAMPRYVILFLSVYTNYKQYLSKVY